MADFDLTEDGLRRLQDRQRNSDEEDQPRRRRNPAGNNTNRGRNHQERPNRRTALQNLRDSLPFLGDLLPTISALIQIPQQNPMVVVVVAFVLYYRRRWALALALRLFVFLRNSLRLIMKTLSTVLVFTMRRKIRGVLLIFIGFMFMLSFMKTKFMRVRKLKSLRPKLRPGYRRLEWTCTCGEHLYRDVEDSVPDPSSESRYARLGASEAQLREHTGTESRRTGGPRIYPEVILSPSQPPSERVSEARSGSSSTATTSGSSANLTTTAASQRTDNREPQFHLCIEMGRQKIERSELRKVATCSDGEFVKRMRLRYEDRRNTILPAWARLRKPDKAIFVKFRLEDLVERQGPFVSILSKYDAPSIPPAAEVAAKNYIYRPCPMEEEPPMDSQTFLHYFYASASDHPDTTWTPRLPLKLGARFVLTHPEWGVYLKEDTDWPLLFGSLCLGLLISGIVAGIYGWKTGDAQTGVAIGTWLTAVFGSGVSMVSFGWR